MANGVKKRVADLLLVDKKYKAGAAWFAVVAVFITLSTAMLLRQIGIAQNHTQQVLDCPATGVVAHTHNADCYDADGDLVCTLPERELHVHDESCYTEERTLVCGLEESEGHAHGDACYDAEGNLICGMEESEGHTHSDECYEVTRTLTCDKEEVTEEHVHGPGCFATVEDAMPAQTFSHEIENADGEFVLGIDVSAPEGALPAGTTMKVDWIDEDKVDQALVQAALDAHADEKDVPAGKLLDLQAVSITFVDEAGDEVKPAEKVAVTLTSALVGGDEAPSVVGVETDAEAQARAEAEGKTQYEIAAGAVETYDEDALEEHELTLSDDQLAFDGGDYTQYVLATTSREMEMQSEGETSRVTVEAPAEAGIPQGSTVRVAEVAPGTEEYEAYEAGAREAMSATSVELARFFDITILDPQGNEVRPQAPVRVKIKLADAPTDGAVPSVVHFDASSGDAAPELIPADVNKRTTKFDAESFSVYGVVYTVDFTYDVDGQTYELSLPGGDAVALSELLPALGVVSAEDAWRFVREIEDVEFSNTEVVSVAHMGEDITVAALREQFDLPVEYSAGLTDKQIAAIESKTIEADDWALVGIKPFDTEEILTVTMKDGEAFTIRVTDEQISTSVLSADGKAYDVTVTYDEAAKIPEGSTLRVTEFAQDSEEYDYARKSVLADKKERGEWVDLNTFNLAALDISIINPEGEEIEPSAEVQVDIQIKELPGVEDLSEVADTLAVQHHVEVKDGVVVETVFDGGAEASFAMDMKAEKKNGTPVDPNSVSEEDFAEPEQVASEVPDASEGKEKAISFNVSAFSTFTVTWMKDRSSDNSTIDLIWRSSGWNPTTYSDITIHYLDMNGEPIQAPRDNQTVTNQTTVSITSGSYTNIPGYVFDHARVWYDQSAGQYWNLDEVSVQFLNYYGTLYTLIRHGGENYKVGPYNNQTYRDEIELYFRKENTESISAMIHYVDEAGNELEVSNGQPVSDYDNQVVSYSWSEEDQDFTIPVYWHYNYLIYDVEGYEYAYTYRNSDTTDNRITPILNYRNNSWRYTAGTETFGPYNTWTNLSENDDIYVVYKPKGDATDGGTPKPKISGEKPDEPTITKSSVVNGDGTNTLALSVTGHTTNMEAEKLADVIVIYDVSGSMNFKMDAEEEAADGERRMDYAQAATKALADSLLGKNTTDHPELVRMSLISFSNTATKVQDFTADETVFDAAVDALPSPEGGTNWEDALQMANEMAVESDRATFVIFVTDGNPTFRKTRGVLNNGGTDGLSDEDIGRYYFLYDVFGTGNSDVHGRNYSAALTQAQSIVDHNKIFYTIGISSDVTNLTKLTTEAGAGADHSKTATSNEELVAAFDDIAASIIALMGHSDIQITDGITELTQTVQKSDLVSYAEDDFTYSKERLATQEEINDPTKVPEGAEIVNREGTRYVVWNNWNPTSEDCAKATYDKTSGAVKWNMGEGFMLEDGYTYQVRFKVWPSQEAYDLLAGLNNGIYVMDDENKVIRDAEGKVAYGTDYYNQISGSYPTYYLKTNSDTSYTYREATKSGDTVTPTGNPSWPKSFDDVDPLELTTKPLQIMKQWHNNYSASREPVDSITMQLYGVDPDGTTSHDFKTIELTRAGGWHAENNYISYGLVTYDTATNAGAKIYETGHDFTLREIDDEAHYFELTAGIYRPMVINGTPTILERVDKAPAGMSAEVFHYSDGSHHYYRMDGNIYRDTQSDILMVATNSRRSYMDLNKVVVDDAGDAVLDDTEFEYKVTFTVPPDIYNHEAIEKYIWFSVYDNVAKRTLSPSEYTYANARRPTELDELDIDFSGPEYANYLVVESGQQLTLKIKQGWNVRFLNLPIGTTYSFEETNIPDGYNFVKAEVSGSRWIANMVNGEDKGAAQDMSPLPSNTSGSNSNTTIGGTIEYANARYSTTYTNRAVTKQVNILKTGQDGTTPLEGAKFSLYTKSGYERDPKVASVTNLTSNSNGIIGLGKLSVGKYYLVETDAPAGYNLLADPVEITVTKDGVTYKQSGNNLSNSSNGVDFDEETQTYKLTVTNNAGHELPASGGSGTWVFTALGIAMVAGAGLLLMRDRGFV